MTRTDAITWYDDTASARADYTPLYGDARADVLVLGGGFTGLSAALALAERGLKPILLEAGRIGGGASGRNGGQIVTGYNQSIPDLTALVGPADARLLWDLGEAAKTLLARRVARYGIACDLTQGYLFAALKPRHRSDLAAMVDSWVDYGYEEARLVDRAEMAALTGSDAYRGGVVDQGGGHLHPLNYALGLARALDRCGGAIHEQSRITRIDRGRSIRVATDQGTVTAPFAVLAGNALLGGLVPELRTRIAPVGTYIAATEPMTPDRVSPDRAAAILPGNAAVADANFVLNYFRKTPDHRLLFGAGVSYTGVEPPGLARAMHRAMVALYPALATLRFHRVWGGLVDISVNRLPHLGRLDDNLYFAQGFSGQGVTLTGMAGQVMAEAIAGQAERFDCFARIPHRPFPGGMLRTPALALAMLWYRLRDQF